MKEYGMDKCPYNDPELVQKAIEQWGDDCGLCYDLDHLGGIACGLCGANRQFAKQAQENFIRAVDREARKINNGKRWRTILHTMARK